jgi:hypothetical protein
MAVNAQKEVRVVEVIRTAWEGKRRNWFIQSIIARKKMTRFITTRHTVSIRYRTSSIHSSRA